MFLGHLEFWGIIWANSAFFLIMGYWITAKAYRDDNGLFKKKLGISKKVNRATDQPNRSDDAVVPEWGKE